MLVVSNGRVTSRNLAYYICVRACLTVGKRSEGNDSVGCGHACFAHVIVLARAHELELETRHMCVPAIQCFESKDVCRSYARTILVGERRLGNLERLNNTRHILLVDEHPTRRCLLEYGIRSTGLDVWQRHRTATMQRNLTFLRLAIMRKKHSKDEFRRTIAILYVLLDAKRPGHEGILEHRHRRIARLHLHGKFLDVDLPRTTTCFAAMDPVGRLYLGRTIGTRYVNIAVARRRHRQPVGTMPREQRRRCRGGMPIVVCIYLSENRIGLCASHRQSVDKPIPLLSMRHASGGSILHTIQNVACVRNTIYVGIPIPMEVRIPPQIVDGAVRLCFVETINDAAPHGNVEVVSRRFVYGIHKAAVTHGARYERRIRCASHFNSVLGIRLHTAQRPVGVVDHENFVALARIVVTHRGICPFHLARKVRERLADVVLGVRDGIPFNVTARVVGFRLYNRGPAILVELAQLEGKLAIAEVASHKAFPRLESHLPRRLVGVAKRGNATVRQLAPILVSPRDVNVHASLARVVRSQRERIRAFVVCVAIFAAVHLTQPIYERLAVISARKTQRAKSRIAARALHTTFRVLALHRLRCVRHNPRRTQYLVVVVQKLERELTSSQLRSHEHLVERWRIGALR